MKSIVFALLLATPSFAAIEDRIAAEAKRLDAALVKIDESKLPKELAGSIKSAREHLADVNKPVSPLLRLYRFRESFVEATALVYMNEHQPASSSLDEFLKLWNATKPQFEKPSVTKGPLVQRALVQSSVNRAQKYYKASLPYGKADFPWSGTYYLAESDGNLQFASFVDSLAIASPARTESKTSAAALSAALDALEKETLAVFEKDPASRNALPVSAHLKETRELIDRGWSEGATLTLLESRFGLTRRAGKPVTTPPATTATAGQDTLVDLFGAMADEDKDNAGYIRSAVLPFYSDLRNAPAAPVQTAAARAVTVTLVRWPYT